MALLTRLTQLVKADAHGVVDALEDRALVLRQQLRDATAEVVRKRALLDALVAEDKDLVLEDGQLAERIRQLDDDIALALEQEQDDLARFAVKKLLPLRQARERISQRRHRLDTEREELADRLAEQEEQLDDLGRRVRGYLARLERGDDGLGGFDPSWVVADEDVELELLRRRQQASGEA